MRTLAGALARRDLRLVLARGTDSLLGVFFFLIALSLFPLGVGASADVLERIGAGVIWVLALLAVLLTLDRLYQADAEDGSLELLALSGQPLELVVAVKCLSTGSPAGSCWSSSRRLMALLMALPDDAYLGSACWPCCWARPP